MSIRDYFQKHGKILPILKKKKLKKKWTKKDQLHFKAVMCNFCISLVFGSNGLNDPLRLRTLSRTMF